VAPPVFASIAETLVDQRVDQNDPFTNALTTIQSSFALTDVSIGYRLPKRWGVISLEVRNLFDEEFGYQDTNFFGTPRIPLFQPGRTVLLRFSLYH
jgi:outer membrane receptor protein involved in Fe transport